MRVAQIHITSPWNKVGKYVCSMLPLHEGRSKKVYFVNLSHQCREKDRKNAYLPSPSHNSIETGGKIRVF